MKTTTAQLALDFGIGAITDQRGNDSSPQRVRREYIVFGGLIFLFPIYHLTRLERDATNVVYCACSMVRWYWPREERREEAQAREILYSVLESFLQLDGEDSAHHGRGEPRDEIIEARLDSYLKNRKLRKALLGFVPIVGAIGSAVINSSTAAAIERAVREVRGKSSSA